MKILSLENILRLRNTLKSEGKRLILCHGHFNVIHPGHLRILNYAKEQGDLLVVSILNDSEILPALRQDFFSQEDRVKGVEALRMVDVVYSLPGGVVDFIKELKPDAYVKGREFEGTEDKEILEELETVLQCGGENLFSSGEVEYSVPRIYNESFILANSPKSNFMAVCKKNDIDFREVSKTVNTFNKLKMLVIGDSIVDQFVGCDMLGVSSEAPVLAIRELVAKDFIGGAAIVAHHIKSMGAECSYLSVLGNDSPADFVRRSCEEAGILSFLFQDKERPTTYKIRYMVDNQKILRVSRLKQHAINFDLEKKIIDKLKELIPHQDGVVISDFVYGVVTENILENIRQIAAKHNVRVFGDLQCSSQVGNVSKLSKIELITPTEKEARIAMGDYTSGLEKLAQNLIKKTQNKHLVITLGAQGLLAYTRLDDMVVSEFFPALESNPVDVAGAGDAMLSAYALGLCSGLNLLESSALGACASAISVNRIGNIPISKKEILEYLQEMNSFVKPL